MKIADKYYRYLHVLFWTLSLCVAAQFLLLGWSRDAGVDVIKACIYIQTGLSIPILLDATANRLSIVMAVAFAWGVFLIVAPSITLH